MVFYIVLFFSFFLIAFLFRAFRRVFYTLALDSVAMVDAFMDDADEEEKLKLVQQRNGRLIVSLMKMLFLIVVAFAIGSIPVILYGLLSETPLREMDFSSFYAILSISLGATIPFLLPVNKKNRSGYSELSQLLHRLALDNYNLADKLFRLESKKLQKKGLTTRTDFIIVSGLARAGTTSLMNDLSKIPGFVSLNYANMPFLMATNYWAKVYKPKTKKLQERSHKDGIMIGMDSNEALEEYFFKVKASDAYIAESQLTEYAISKEDYLEYLDYQSVIKQDNQKIYLAKNNNFMLRYKSVREFNDDFLMVILYRDPLTHAASLLEKHRDYKKLQSEDPFVLKYMNWLGHHEFGQNHKPFVFSNSALSLEEDMETLDYWLKIWINYYSYVLTINDPQTILVNYDFYCRDPKGTMKIILKKANISAEIPDYQPFDNRRKTAQICSDEIYEAAQKVYQQLSNR